MILSRRDRLWSVSCWVVISRRKFSTAFHVSTVTDWWLMDRMPSAVLEQTLTPEQPNRRRRHSSPLNNGEWIVLWEDFAESPFPYWTYRDRIISKTSLNLVKSMVNSEIGIYRLMPVRNFMVWETTNMDHVADALNTGCGVLGKLWSVVNAPNCIETISYFFCRKLNGLLKPGIWLWSTNNTLSNPINYYLSI